MLIRHGRTLVAASLLSAGLLSWSGCSTENPDGTPTNLGNAEVKAKQLEKKAEEGLKNAGEVIKKDAKIVEAEIEKDAKIAGQKIKDGYEKAKDAVTDKKPQ